MDTVAAVLPDGKYVMSAELFFKLKVEVASKYSYVYDMRDEVHGEEVYVRVCIVDGEVFDFSYAIHNGNWRPSCIHRSRWQQARSDVDMAQCYW